VVKTAENMHKLRRSAGGNLHHSVTLCEDIMSALFDDEISAGQVAVRFLDLTVYAVYETEWNSTVVRVWGLGASGRPDIPNGLELTSSVIGIRDGKSHPGHAIAGFVCEGVEYVYDSNLDSSMPMYYDSDRTTYSQPIYRGKMIQCNWRKGDLSEYFSHESERYQPVVYEDSNRPDNSEFRIIVTYDALIFTPSPVRQNGGRQSKRVRKFT
jgi:hypothetical protein